jgi:uncharacterized protein YndB with AHSA1/START domain
MDMKSINSKAPVKCSKMVTIRASSERVWAILTDINNWPTWQTDISQSVVHGDVRPGTTFDWKSGGVKINSTLHTVEPYRNFGWTGRSLGMTAIHNWTLMESNGQTIVSVAESMEGFIATLLRRSLNSNIDTGMHNWLTMLKQEIEKSHSNNASLQATIEKK